MIYLDNSTEEQAISIPRVGVVTGVTPSSGKYYAGQYIDINAANVISVTGITPVTKTSQLVNDSGFLTEHQSLENYYTTAQTESAISAAVANKVASTTATEIWTGTEEEYQEITIKSATTIYLIK